VRGEVALFWLGVLSGEGLAGGMEVPFPLSMVDVDREKFSPRSFPPRLFSGKMTSWAPLCPSYEELRHPLDGFPFLKENQGPVGTILV